MAPSKWGMCLNLGERRGGIVKHGRALFIFLSILDLCLLANGGQGIQVVNAMQFSSLRYCINICRFSELTYEWSF